MANASQFIGSKISLISKSEIRYEGILYSLDVVEATISLAKVKSFGTEGRVTERPVPPKDEIYEFIIFRGSDIKGIDVVEPPKPAGTILNEGLPNDPAIVEVSHYHSPARPPPQHSNIGPVPVQVQASSAYSNAMSGASYGSSGFDGSSSTTAPLTKPVPSHQPSRISTMSSALVDDSPEPLLNFEANDLKETSGSNASNQRPERESQAKLPYGRGSARGQGHGFSRGGDERPRGGRGGGRGSGGNRGRSYESESAGREDGVGQQRRPQGQESGHQQQEAPWHQRREGTGHQRQGQEAVGHHRQETAGHPRQQRQEVIAPPRQGQEATATGNQQQAGEDGTGEQRQGYQRRSSGGSGNYNNKIPRGGGGGGYRGGRGGYRTQGILRAPQSAKVTFDNDFDFEKANEELQTAIKNLKLTEKANELAAAESNGGSEQQQVHHLETEEQENKEPPTCYKKDDFFDSISCEALEREKGANNRPDWRAERKLNAETFGLTGRGRGGGGYYRGGGRGYYNNRGGYGGYGHGGGYGGYRGGGPRGGGGYSSYNNRYNNGGGTGGGRRGGRGASNSNPEGTTTQGSGSF